MVSSGEYLSFLSIDKWTMIFNLVNTFILYKIIKKFLFKPVNKIINDRKSEIQKNYDDSEKIRLEADVLKKSYETKIQQSNKEAQDIINSAKTMATQQSDEILNQARIKANNLIENANHEIKLESQKAINTVKDEIADLAILTATKLIKKEIKKDEHTEIINNLLDEIEF